MLASTYKKLEERGRVPAMPTSLSEVHVKTLSEMKEDIAAIPSKVTSLVERGTNALGDLLSGVGKVIDKYAPTLLAGMASAQFRGTQGSFMSYCTPIKFQYRYFTIAPDRSTEIGYPLHRYKTLSTMSGFVLCENARLPMDVTLTEQKAVEEFLNGGVYLE